MQRSLHSFFTIKPKDEKKEGELVEQLKRQREEEYKRSQAKEREIRKKEIQQFQQEMECEEKQISSYQRMIVQRDRKERRQRQLGIGCQITSQIYIGSVESSNNQSWLELEGINVIINCTAECHNDIIEGISYHRLPVWGYSKSIRQFVGECVDLINAHSAAGDKILLHSEIGNNRAPAFVLAYIIRHQKVGYGKAYTLLQEKCWRMELSLEYITELNKIAEEMGLDHIERSSSYHIPFSPYIKRTLEDADFHIEDRRKKREFGVNPQ